MRLFALCVSLVVGLLPAEAADLAGPPQTAALICYDTYCGQRKYPDPFIVDGWRGSDPRYDMNLDITTWYRLRTMKPVYVPAGRGFR